MTGCRNDQLDVYFKPVPLQIAADSLEGREGNAMMTRSASLLEKKSLLVRADKLIA
jgi:hypothetical protein